MKFSFEIGPNVMPYCRDIDLIKNYLVNNKYDNFRVIGENTIVCTKNEIGTLTITVQGNFFIDKDIYIPEDKQSDEFINKQIRVFINNLKSFVMDMDELLNSNMISDEIRAYWPDNYKHVVKKGVKIPYVTRIKYLN